jgi:hypothetical protein
MARPLQPGDRHSRRHRDDSGSHQRLRLHPGVPARRARVARPQTGRGIDPRPPSTRRATPWPPTFKSAMGQHMQRLGNLLVIGLLRSPFHRLASSSLVLITDRGHDSGRRFTVNGQVVSRGRCHPTLSRLLPHFPAIPGERLPPATPRRDDGEATKVSHLHPNQQRLVAHCSKQQ